MSELIPHPAANQPTTRIIVQPSSGADFDERQRVLEQVRKLAWVLDRAVVIPGTNFRVGLDPLIGMIPILGDLITMAIGGYLIMTGARLGVPRSVIIRMFMNIGTDTVLGSVPVAGDVLDAAWRANSKNAALLERALLDPKGVGRASWWMIAGLSLLMIALLVGSIVLAIWLSKLIWATI